MAIGEVIVCHTVYQVITGTPTRKDFDDMVPGMANPLLPVHTPKLWTRLNEARTSKDAINVIQNMLQYNPSARTAMSVACEDPFLVEVRSLPHDYPCAWYPI